jgi:Secretion system C-terminal sorting domain
MGGIIYKSHTFIHLSIKQLDMKSFFTSLFNAKNLVLSLFFCAPTLAMAQLFSQDFSGTLASAIGNGVSQFDFIGRGTAAGTSSTYLSSGRLVLDRGNGGTAAAVRSTPFSSTTPTALKVTFQLDVLYCFNNTSSSAIIYVGSGFSSSSSSEAAAHSRFGVLYNGTDTWVIRQVNGTSSNSSTFDDDTPKNISWFINNSGSSINYAAPDGTVKMLADDVADIWIGNGIVFAAVPTGAGTQTLDNIKFYHGANSGAIAIDNVVVSALPLTLPVTLTSFTANKAEAANQLTWATASEQNASHYTVERSLDAKNFAPIGKVSAQGKAATYNFTDDAPLSISYYRLRQVDVDGAETFSKIVSVSQDTKGRISITPNPTSDKVNINLNQKEASNQTTTVILSDMTGRQILTQSTTSGALELDMSNLAKGMYVLTVQSNNAIYQEKIIRQ